MNSLLYNPCGFSSLLLIIASEEPAATGDDNKGRLNQKHHTRFVGGLILSMHSLFSLLYSFSADEILLNPGKTFRSSSIGST